MGKMLRYQDRRAHLNKKVRLRAFVGLDHRAGHPMPFESTPWLAEAD
jgi:hypothetical protein